MQAQEADCCTISRSLWRVFDRVLDDWRGATLPGCGCCETSAAWCWRKQRTGRSLHY